MYSRYFFSNKRNRNWSLAVIIFFVKISKWPFEFFVDFEDSHLSEPEMTSPGNFSNFINVATCFFSCSQIVFFI